MREVRWDAFIEVKFRGNSPGFEFAAAPTSSIASDVEKLQRLRAHCDHALVVVEEVPPLRGADIDQLESRGPDVALRFVRP